MQWVITAISILFEYYTIKTFFNCFYKSKSNNIDLLGLFISFIFFIFSIIFSNFTSYMSIVYIFMLSCLYNIENIKNRFVYTILIFLFLSVMEVVIAQFYALIFGMSITGLQNNIGYYAFAVVSSKLITYIIVNVSAYFYKRENKNNPINISFPALVISSLTFLSFCMLGRILYLATNKGIMFLGTITMILLVIAFLFYLEYYNLYKETKLAKYEIEVLKQHIFYNKKHNEQIVENIEIIKEIKHNLTNQLIGISELIDNNEIEKARQYILKITKSLNLSINKDIFTGIIYIDAIISNKTKIAKANNILLYIESDIVNIGNIDEVDLGVLIGCAFDNALESNLKIKNNRYINVHFSTKGQYFVFKMINPIMKNEKVNINVTSKKIQSNYHGYGIRSIEKIAKKYGGSCNIYIENNEFSILIMLNIK